TEAGARVVPRKADLLAVLVDRRRRLARESARLLSEHGERLSQRRTRLSQALPGLLRPRAQRVERVRAQLARVGPRPQLQRRRERLAELRTRTEAAVRRMLRLRAVDLANRNIPARLSRALAARFQSAQSGLAQRRSRLQALSPEGVLTRGYSITLDDTGRV